MPDTVFRCFGVFHRLCRIDRQRKYCQVSIFIGDIDGLSCNQWGRPTRGAKIARPVNLASLGIQAMHQSAEVGNEQETAFNGRAADCPVHCFVKVELSISIFVAFVVMPYHRRVRIRYGLSVEADLSLPWLAYAGAVRCRHSDRLPVRD